MNVKHKILMLFLVFACFTNVKAQSNFVNSSNKLFFEKVYLHTDREIYAVGESIWFSAFLVNAQTNQFITTSNTLYVELSEVNEKSGLEVIDKRIIKLDDGKGEGDFKLSDSLPGGRYVLTAWTNWMLNFGDNFVFSKEINVVGNEIETPTKKVTINKNLSIDNSLFSSTHKVDPIKLLPEGGALVENVPGVIAYKSLRGGFNAVITNFKNETISELSSPQGVGSFIINPSSDESYILTGTFLTGESFKIKFPAILKSGFAIRAINKDSLINLHIGTNNNSDMIGKDVLVLGKSKGKTYFTFQFTIKELQSLVQIPKKSFPEGIASITLIDEQGKPHSERLVYIEKDSKNINFNLQTNKTVYKYGDSVKVNIKLTDSLDQPVIGVVSLAAVDTRFPENQININSYLMLKSEIKGEIENPNQYFDKKNPNRLRHLDLLLLTQGWRDFVWRKIADSAIVIKRIPEQGISVSGKVRQLFVDKPVANANVTLIANGAKNDKIFAAQTSSDGSYFIDGIDMFGSQILKLNSVDQKGKKNGWIHMDSIFKESNIKLKLDREDINYFPLLNKEINEIFKNKKLLENKSRLADTIRLDEVRVKGIKDVRLMGDVVSDFGYPDENYIVTSKDFDYTDLNHYLMHKSNSFRIDSSNRLVYNIGAKKKNQPLLIVNNKQVFMDDDPQQIKDEYSTAYYGLTMDKVEKVLVRRMIGVPKMDFDVETSMHTMSEIRDLVLVYLTLKPGALDKKKFYAINEEVNGYYEKRSFYESNEKSLNNTDLRSTIYWNPFVKTNLNGEATVSFINTNQEFPINITVEGITLGGLAITNYKNYNVKK